MNNSTKIIGIIFIIAVLAVASFFAYKTYSDDSSDSQSLTTSTQKQEQSTTEEKEEIAGQTVITTGDSDFGEMLFDDNGQAIYIWEVEETSTPECYDDCAEAWPPVLTDGDPVADGDVDNELLGTTERTDGTTQVTYNDHPLYYYAHEGPDEVKCHNVSTHGGLWWVIQPNGIRAD